MQHNHSHSQKESNTLKVYHTQSTISSFYDMSAPIQLTLSYCSGLSDQLLHAMLIPRLGSTFAIKSLVCQLFQYLDTKEYYHISNVTLNSSSDLLLFSRISHLMEDTNGRMSRLALEKALCYSGNYINTIVKKYTGMCLYDYGLSFTLKNAASLLTETDIPISSISAQLGFTNRTHFYKDFREKYGVSPGEYRKIKGTGSA